jgi:hypothetical protein
MSVVTSLLSRNVVSPDSVTEIPIRARASSEITRLVIEKLAPLKKNIGTKIDLKWMAREAATQVSQGDFSGKSLKELVIHFQKFLPGKVKSNFLDFLVNDLQEIRKKELQGMPKRFALENKELFNRYIEVVSGGLGSSKESKFNLLKKNDARCVVNFLDLQERIIKSQERIATSCKEEQEKEIDAAARQRNFQKQEQEVGEINMNICTMLLTDFKGYTEKVLDCIKERSTANLPDLTNPSVFNEYIDREKVERLFQKTKKIFTRERLGNCPVAFLSDHHIKLVVKEMTKFFLEQIEVTEKYISGGLSKKQNKQLTRGLMEFLRLQEKLFVLKSL